jgi:predicted MFS family arabinose efflux permease
MSQATLSRLLTVLGAAAVLAGYFSGFIHEHRSAEEAVVSALILSEALAQIPYIKSNSVAEAIVNAVAAVLRRLAGR